MSPSDIAFLCVVFAVMVLWIITLHRARHADAKYFADKEREYANERDRLKQENEELSRKVSALQDKLTIIEQRLQDARVAASRVIIPPTAEELENAKNRAAEAKKKLEQAKNRIQNLNYEKEQIERRANNCDITIAALRSQRQSIDDLYRRAAQSALRKAYVQNSFLCRSFAHATLDACAEKITSAADERIEILPSTHLCFEIRGASSAVYRTTLNDCTCPDFQHRHQPCKHMYRIALELGLLSDLGEQANAQIAACAAETAALKESRKKIKAAWALLNQKKQTFPYLADLFAELDRYEAEAAAAALRAKSFPAVKKAEEIESNGKKLAKLRRENKSLRYQLNYLKDTVPWLEEFITLPPAQAYAAETAAAVEDEYNLYREWLNPDEWNMLAPAEKVQIALNRYRENCIHGNPTKTAWEAGIEYERYIGYRYEQHGFSVRYTGATDGLGDLGRDLIARKEGRTLIIQCKRWNAHKTIHEKHIFQLYGTLEKYRFEHPQEQCIGVFISTAELSPIAKDAANFFEIEARVIPYSAEYPMVKCNIAANGERIYHLPMDQQYDRVAIEKKKGECYAETVAEAESLGFRRAKKWKSDNQNRGDRDAHLQNQ